MKRIAERLPTPWHVAWLTGVWVLLWGDLSWGNLVNGALLAVAVHLVMPLPVVAITRHIRPLAVVVLVTRFAWDVVVGATHVAIAAFRPRSPRSAVLRVQLRSHSDLILATTSGLTTLIPGSVVIEAHRLTGVIYLHLFDVPTTKPMRYINQFRTTVVAQEERLLRAFATDDELRDAGYQPGWRCTGLPERKARK